MKRLSALALLCCAAFAQAQIVELSDDALSSVSSQGISIARLHLEIGGTSTGAGITEVKPDSIFLGFGEYAGSTSYIAIEHLNGYIDFQTPLLIDVVDNGASQPQALQLTLPDYIDVKLGIDSISAQNGLNVDRESVNIVKPDGTLIRTEIEPQHNLGSIQIVGRLSFNPGSTIQIFGH